jgi:hypothetical protein
MKRLAVISVMVFACVLIACSALTYAQDIFKIPFKFKAGGKTFAAGEYVIAPKGEGQIALRKEPGGEEAMIAVQGRLAQPEKPVAEVRVVFDVVGNFEPSYTEYITEYVLAEFWLPGEEGYLIHATKGAHQNKIITGEKAK